MAVQFQEKNAQCACLSQISARVNFFNRFRTNKEPWPVWVFDQIGKEEACRVLEIGSGSGLLWQQNTDRIPAGWDVTLSDYSCIMLENARKGLSRAERSFSYRTVGAEGVDFDDASAYDIIIASNLPYYSKSLCQNIARIRSLLAENGVLYATTCCSQNNMLEIKALLQAFFGEPEAPVFFDKISETFTLENGFEMLMDEFNDVEMRHYKDTMQIDDAEAVAGYLHSFHEVHLGSRVIRKSEIDDFCRHLDGLIVRDGHISTTRNFGMFICRHRPF